MKYFTRLKRVKEDKEVFVYVDTERNIREKFAYDYEKYKSLEAVYKISDIPEAVEVKIRDYKNGVDEFAIILPLDTKVMNLEFQDVIEEKYLKEDCNDIINILWDLELISPVRYARLNDININDPQNVKTEKGLSVLARMGIISWEEYEERFKKIEK